MCLRKAEAVGKRETSLGRFRAGSSIGWWERDEGGEDTGVFPYQARPRSTAAGAWRFDGLSARGGWRPQRLEVGVAWFGVSQSWFEGWRFDGAQRARTLETGARRR